VRPHAVSSPLFNYSDERIAIFIQGPYSLCVVPEQQIPGILGATQGLHRIFFLEEDSFPSLFDVPLTCLALSGVWNSGAHITVELEVGLGKACDVGAACY